MNDNSRNSKPGSGLGGEDAGPTVGTTRKRLPGELGWRQDYSGPEAAAIDRQRAWFNRMFAFPAWLWGRLALAVWRGLSDALKMQLARELRPYLVRVHAEEKRKAGGA